MTKLKDGACYAEGEQQNLGSLFPLKTYVEYLRRGDLGGTVNFPSGKQIIDSKQNCKIKFRTTLETKKRHQ